VRIAQITTHILRSKLSNSFYSSQQVFSERNSLLVRITTADGQVGWGEGGQYGPPTPVAAIVNDVFAPILLGRTIDGPVPVWDELYSYSRDFGQKGSYVEALSAIDIALWDLWGKSLGLPIHVLLGGAARSEVVAYATGGYYSSDFGDVEAAVHAVRAEVLTYVEGGFSAFKMKVGLLPLAADIKRLEAAMDSAGEGLQLIVDANHAYSAANAIRFGRILDANNVQWFEEPVMPEDHEGYRRVRDALDLPVAGGEAEFTRYGFRDLLTDQCIDIAQPDVCVCGGFSEFLKIYALSATFGVRVIPHAWGSGVALAAGLHAAAVIPSAPSTYSPVPFINDPVIEFDRSPNPLRDDLLLEPFSMKGGALSVPTGPGLGVTIDEDKLMLYGTPC